MRIATWRLAKGAPTYLVLRVDIAEGHQGIVRAVLRRLHVKVVKLQLQNSGVSFISLPRGNTRSGLLHPRGAIALLRRSV